MDMKQIKLIAIAFMLVGAFACTTTKKAAPVDNTVKEAAPPTPSMAELQQGHDLFVSNCGKCHKLPDPASRPADSWKKVMDVMAPKAKLDATQADLVYKYIVTQ
jgi:mono/diheme cytochrome c family protein